MRPCPAQPAAHLSLWPSAPRLKISVWAPGSGGPLAPQGSPLPAPLGTRGETSPRRSPRPEPHRTAPEPGLAAPRATEKVGTPLPCCPRPCYPAALGPAASLRLLDARGAAAGDGVPRDVRADALHVHADLRPRLLHLHLVLHALRVRGCDGLAPGWQRSARGQCPTGAACFSRFLNFWDFPDFGSGVGLGTVSPGPRSAVPTWSWAITSGPPLAVPTWSPPSRLFRFAGGDLIDKPPTGRFRFISGDFSLSVLCETKQQQLNS